MKIINKWINRLKPLSRVGVELSIKFLDDNSHLKWRSLLNIVETLKDYRRVYKNWLSVAYHTYVIINRTDDRRSFRLNITLRNTGEALRVSHPLAYALVLAKKFQNSRITDLRIEDGKLCFNYKSHNLKFDIGNGADPFAAFFKEEYDFLKVKNETVVDIGTNIGDTAIYFCIQGAKRVIALEPYPYTASLAKKNVDTTSFKDKIVILNAGYGKDGEIEIDTEFIPSNASAIKESLNGIPIKVFSLMSIVSKYNITKGILKMDCEGCEYNLLEEDDEILKKFSMFQIEFHKGSDNLIKKLQNCGFKVGYDQYSYINDSTLSEKKMVGYIFAENINHE